MIGHEQCAVIAGSEQLIGRLIDAVHRAEAMDDPAIGQPMRAGEHGLPRPDRRERAAFRLEPGPRSAMDRAGHPTAGPQHGIRRIHDRGNARLTGDVTLDAFDGDARKTSQYRLFHRPPFVR